ncbi:MAG TPA: methionyl-tRNA formyltransferase [Candidatus Levybacteria bacterium]|nr:methionyl-tRNA formyltransferase [Candidatus Levybacteria bacterium]
MKQKIVFFGSGDYSIPVIQMLVLHGLKLVLTTETQGPLISYLKSENVPFLSTKVTEDKQISKQELWQQVEAIQPTLGVLASFGAIIPQRIIDLFPQGIWNIHPSLLPKYKGPSPIQATILSGDTETGVSIITLDDQVDHGPILAQEKVLLTGSETTQQLKNELFSKGAEMIKNLLESLENGNTITHTPQKHDQETWTEKIIKQNGRIGVGSPPARDVLDRMIRAYYPWPGVMFEWEVNGKKKLIKLLPENTIQVEGKREMKFKEFINGYQEEGRKLLETLNLL